MPDRHQSDDLALDQDLIAKAAAGDQRAFEMLVKRHAAAVLRLTTAMTGNAASAEDAMQQTFLSAYRSAASFREEASVRTWLLTIARNASHRLHAKQRREDLVEEPLMNLGVGAGWGTENPEALAIAAERRDVLQRALGTLAPADREVLVLRDVYGLRGAEAAKALGIGERALKSRLHRARLRLAVALRASAVSKESNDAGGTA